MIARLTGTLADLDPQKNLAIIAAGGGLGYEVLLPAFLTHRLATSEGKPLTLHTLCFLEGTAQGATMFPRLAGFQNAEQRAFFELFVTVKGIGHRKAMRAMVMDPATLAGAIADRDLKLLQTMPEVGKKLAETIAVTLRDKVGGFASAAAYTPGEQDAADDGGGAAPPPAAGARTLARDTLEVMLQLGENRSDAVQLIDRVLSAEDPPQTVEAVISAVYAARAAG